MVIVRCAWFGCVLSCLACGPSEKNPSAPNGGSGGAAGADESGSGGAPGGRAGAANGGGASGGSPDAGSGGTVVGPVIEPGDPGAHDVTFTIRADEDVRPISPLIYGVNAGALSCTDAGARPTLCRLGGNRWTAYNWENNASNAGSDYCFQNDGLISTSNAPGQGVLDVLDETRAAGIPTIVTIPIVDHVSADKMGGSAPPGCSGDVRNSGADYLTTRFKRNQAAKGAAFSAAPDASDASVSQDEFAAFLSSKSDGARVLFSLDNEPDLWSATHAEVHPTPVTYEDLVRRNVDYSRAIRAAWPEAEILGFVSYGFNGYVNLQAASDRNGKGEFVDYYLTRLREAEAAEGRRLVDYLDLHWYPEARGGGTRITESSTAAATVEARVQAPRSLWDPDYAEDSWITEFKGGDAIALIPWLRAKIDASYPGTKLAFTEWNYGAGGHVSGAIAAADVLGVFGREGVALATLWPLSANESYNLAAIRMYRNFDGAGASFGDTSMRATSSDVARAAVYASFDAENPGRAVIVAINRTASPLSAGVTVAHATEFTRADSFVLDASAPEPRPGAAVEAVATNAFVYELPAHSVSVIVPRP